LFGIEKENIRVDQHGVIVQTPHPVVFGDKLKHPYKSLAVKAAKALNVKITGLDMIIKDYCREATKDNYAIIELNFNPAIHIHCYPHRGKNRRLNERLLDMLGYSFR
jgi:glutamate--cysteine ligase